jgi:hypothetical protein
VLPSARFSDTSNSFAIPNLALRCDV